MAVAAHPHPVEHTTALALEEKKKLQKALRRFDMLFFTICAFVGLDTLGIVASNGRSGVHVADRPGRRVRPPVRTRHGRGRERVHAGGRPLRVDEARVRAILTPSIAAVYYWITNPLWVGGSLAFIATAAWVTSSNHCRTSAPGRRATTSSSSRSSGSRSSSRSRRFATGSGSRPPAAFMRMAVLGFFTITVIVYAGKHGVHGIAASDLKPTSAIFLALVPLLLFNYVGFELQNGAAEEMVNPQRDVPIAVAPQRDHRGSPLHDSRLLHPARPPDQRRHRDRRFHRCDRRGLHRVRKRWHLALHAHCARVHLHADDLGGRVDDRL